MFRVYLKELLELTRDRKTLIFTILLPTLIMPVIMFGFAAVTVKIANKAVTEELKYAIIGQQYYPGLVDEIKKDDSMQLVDIPEDKSAKQYIENNEIRFALEIEESAADKLDNKEPVNIKMLYNDSLATSELIYQRVNKALKDYKQNFILQRYEQLGLTESQGKGLNEPFTIVKESTANERESLGEKIGGLLPYILIIIGLSGAMYPAIDLGVGEKERGTLETLLLTPVSRFSIVFAKFLVIFTTSFVSIFLTLLSFALISLTTGDLMASFFPDPVFTEKTEQLITTLSGISLLDIFLMFLMLVPIAAIFASILLSVSIYARTFKEAQNYMSPILLVIIFPLIISLLPGVKLDWFWASVPITNISLAIKEIFKGTIDFDMLIVIFVSTTIIAGALLALCNWWFQREQVLFRS
ncbi:MAG: ABC transporter permease [Gammaproteobacteria bacterium]|nr:ABC transporter permease [Gammaproteobacteria bacterium]MDH5628890.1 ABC transporter permease [Gammaproteobacteria bacterium]